MADHTEKYRYYRSQGQKAAAGREKAADISGWTGLSMVDFDHLPEGRAGEVFEKVCADPHTVLAYTTSAGRG